MMPFVERSAVRTQQLGLLLTALFIPFSIAGTNIGLGFVALGWLALSWDAVARDYRRFALRDPLLTASVLLAVSALPSVLISEDSARAWKDWRSYWQLIIYFGVAIALSRSHMRDAVVRALAIASILSCLVAFVQRAGGLHLGVIEIDAQHRVGGTLYTMTFAGVASQLTVFFAALTLGRTMPSRERLLYAVASACLFVALLLTMTRGAWLAAGVGLISLCFLLRNRRVFVAGAVLAVVAVAFSLIYANDQGRTLSLTTLFSSSPDRNVHTRLELWKSAWTIFRAHPILGVGMGDYSTVAARMLADVPGVLTTSDTHNVALHVLATRGLVGFIPFAYFWVTVFQSLRNTLQRTRDGSRARLYAIGAVAAAVTLLVGSLTENNIDDEEVFNAFLLLLATARAAHYAAESEADEAG